MNPQIDIGTPTPNAVVTGNTLDYSVTTSDPAVHAIITVTEVGGPQTGTGILTFGGSVATGTLGVKPFQTGKRYTVTVTSGGTVKTVIVTAQ